MSRSKVRPLAVQLECSVDHATALNTLDLLKKGTSALAHRARAASRILEAQVGTNPRIRIKSTKVNEKHKAPPGLPINAYKKVSTYRIRLMTYLTTF